MRATILDLSSFDEMLIMPENPVSRLVELGVESELARALVRAFSDDDVVPGDAQAAAGEGLTFPLGRWVIRDDDLALLAMLRDASVAGIGTGFATHQLGDPTFVGGIAALIYGVFKLVRQVVKKGVQLGAIEFRVLTIVKRMGSGVTTSELAVELSKGGEPWTAEQAEGELKKLCATALGDGTVVPLVNEDAEGKWTVAGL